MRPPASTHDSWQSALSPATRLAEVKATLKRAAAEIATFGRGAPEGTRVLLYHSVTRTGLGDAGEMTTPLGLFTEHLSILRERGWRVVTATDLVGALRSGARPQPRSVVMTFDDGLADLYDVAAPLMREHGCPSTAFVTVAGLHQSDASLRHPWPGGYLTVQQARELLDLGLVDIGSHGSTHARLGHAPDDVLARETAGAREALEDLLGRTIRLFAYPFGAADMWDERARGAARSAGYDAAFTSIFGVTGAGTDPFEIRRSRVSWRHSAREFRLLLDGAYDWYAGVQRLQVLLRDILDGVR